jgi:pimeloyl-ACP methyl ester carboxylesterase
MGQLGHRERITLPTGVTVPVTQQGDPTGPALVLLHGWTEATGSFDRLVPRFPHWLRVIAFDQRGHGAASKPSDGYRLMDYANDVVAVLDHLEIEQATLLGSSSGGYVGQQAASLHPSRVSGLVLVGAPHSLRTRPAFADEVDKLRDPLDPGWVRSSLTWFPLYARVPEWYLRDRVADALQVPALVWRKALQGLMEAEPPTLRQRLRGPAMVIWGAHDRTLSRASQDSLVRSIEGASLVVYEDAGHLVLWEHPGRVANDATRFMETAVLARQQHG